MTIAVTARATLVGTHTNVATVTGGGGRETNPADNVDDAVTVVPAPQRPPRPQPKPQPPAPACLTLTVLPKMIKADGKPDTVRVRVTQGGKRVRGTKVTHLRRRRPQDGTVERAGHGGHPHQPEAGRPDHDHGDRDEPAGLRPEADRRGRGLPAAADRIARGQGDGTEGAACGRPFGDVSGLTRTRNCG